ncbi:hypothetical protein ES707_12215 [subsurface metagenome]
MGETYDRMKAIADEEEVEEAAKLSGAKAKLLGRLRNRFVPVTFDDGEDGEFTINIRVPSPAQRRRLYEIRYEVVVALEAEDKNKIVALDLESQDLLGKLCLDPSLDADFWRTGQGFDVEVPARLMTVAMGIEPSDREAAEFFRSLEPGPEPGSDA